MIKKCLFCDKKFKAKKTINKFCSRSCSQNYIWSLKYKRIKGNEIIIKNDYAVIKCHNSDMEIKIDIDSLNYVKKYTWHIHCTGKKYYPRTRISKNKTIRLHRYLMCVDDTKLLVDHINGDTLDNRKSNLRICNYVENSVNSKEKLRKNKTSKYKGVYKHKQINKWVAQCRGIHLGTFNTEEEAGLAYNKTALKIYGEYAYLNKI